MGVATSDDLLGLGMPAQLAAMVGANPSKLTTAGTTQATAATMLTRNAELSTGAGQTGAVPNPAAALMNPYWVTNQTATTAVVYVPVGHTLNGTLNSSVNLAQFKSLLLWQYKPKNWTYILTA